MKILSHPVATSYGPTRIARESHAEGFVLIVGGYRNDIIPVILGDDEVTPRYHCAIAGRERARLLARHLFRKVRVEGIGEWELEPSGEWKLVCLAIRSFKRI